MTKDEWKQVEDALWITYHSVKLKIDGYNITLILERETTFKNRIVVYVNGTRNMKWIMDDCEERRRFANKVTKSLLKKKDLTKGKKISKREEKNNDEFLKSDFNKYHYYLPYWYSFGSLKRHFIANNEKIELIGC